MFCIIWQNFVKRQITIESSSKFWEKRQNAVKYVMKFQKNRRMWWLQIELSIFCFIDLILFDGESNWLHGLIFCIIVIKSRKLTPSFWENSLCFYLVVENCLFFKNFLQRKRLFESFCYLFCSISQRGNKMDFAFASFDEIL